MITVDYDSGYNQTILGLKSLDSNVTAAQYGLLKSDHFGIEIVSILLLLLSLWQLKSDHFGIEIVSRKPSACSAFSRPFTSFSKGINPLGTP